MAASDFVAVDEPGAAPLLGTETDNLIPENSDVMIYGDGGAGKTTLTIDLAIYLAAGDDWLGIDVPRRARVGIIENEGPRPLFRRKLERKLAAWTGSDTKGFLFLLAEPWGKVSLDVPHVREALAFAIGKHELDVVIIGPVTRSGMNEAGTLQHVRDFLALFADVREKCGRRISFVLIHHENRGGQVSGAWEGQVDTLLHIQAQGNGQTRVFVQKARWASEHHKQKIQLAWTDGEGFERVEVVERDDNTVADEMRAFVLANGGLTWGKVSKAVKGNADRLAHIRDSLLSSGRLLNRGVPKGSMALWHPDDPALPPVDSEQGTLE